MPATEKRKWFNHCFEVALVVQEADGVTTSQNGCSISGICIWVIFHMSTLCSRFLFTALFSLGGPGSGKNLLNVSSGHISDTCRGEVVENVPLPLGLEVPLLLVKPPVGLATPDIFRVRCMSGGHL